MIYEKFRAKNFGPIGHPWGHWDPYLRGTYIRDFPNLIFLSHGVHTTTLA